MEKNSEFELEKLISGCRDVLKNSYSPYSNFPVGSALLCSDGTIYTGLCLS